MAGISGAIEIIGRGTSSGAAVDTIGNFGGSTLDEVNSSSQLAAAGAGALATVNPGVAISVGLGAIDVQFTKLLVDIQNNSSTIEKVSDIVGLIGDAAVVGSGVSSYLGQPQIGAAFGAIGVATDVGGVLLSHPEQVTSITQSAIDAASSVGSSALQAIGGILGAARDDLNGLTGGNPQSGANFGQNIDAAFPAIADGTGVASVTLPEIDVTASSQTQWTASDGSVHVFLSGEGPTVTQDNTTVDLAPNTSGNISGHNDTINLQGNGSDSIGVFGQNQTVTGDSGNDSVNLGGDGTTATVSGGGYVGLVNNSQTLTLGDSGSNVQTANGVQNETVNGTSDSVTFVGNNSGNVTGQGDTITLQANSSVSIGVFGQNQTVTGDSGNNSVNLGGDGTTATVYGGGYVGLINDGQTLTLGDGGSSVQTAPDVRNETINGSNETITLPANVQVTINGSNDTVYGDGGQDTIIINGADDHFSGNGDSVNFEGDAQSDTSSGTNDSYFVDGSYNGGTDDSGGFEDPGDPEGDEDGDPLVLNLQGGAVQTVDAAQSGAQFDFHNDGKTVKTGWGTPGEGYLVDAVSGQSTVRDGSDLVSSFAALQKLDSNHDDRIDAQDAQWSDLKVWVDEAGTATSQPGSLRSLSDLGITAIDLDPTPDRHRQNGNLILSEGTFTRSNGSIGQIADVDFHTAAGNAAPQTARAPVAAVNLQASTQAAQLVSAMAAFGAQPAAETSIQGYDRPALIPLGVEASHPAHRHAA